MDKASYKRMNMIWEARIKVKTRARSPEDQAMLENALGLDLTLEEIIAILEGSNVPLSSYDDVNAYRRREKIRVKTRMYLAK